MKNDFIRSPLKWAGGKSRLLPEILKYMPDVTDTFIDVFGGSGVVGINSGCPSVVLNDRNPDLVNLYRCLRSRMTRVVEEAAAIWRNDRSSYCEIRDRFNSGAGPATARAAWFLYLNRHCFNGLCRYNAKGGFNVPFGRYSSVPLNRDVLSAFSRALKNADIGCRDFEPVMAESGACMFVYCDPPYAPVDRKGFTRYDPAGFGESEHVRLRDAARLAAGRGAVVAISNSDTPFTRDLYNGADRLESLNVSRSISRNGSGRVPAGELLVVYGAAPS